MDEPRGVSLERFLARPTGPDPSITASVVATVAEVGKKIYRAVGRAGVAGMWGEVGKINVQGESVKKLDEYANNTFLKSFRKKRLVGALISEEMEDVARIADVTPGGEKYLLTYDPLDGSSNIDVNVTVGSIFGLYRVPPGGKLSTLLQPGRKLIAAGYVLYGNALNFVFWRQGGTVNGFTFDADRNAFHLTNPDLRMPVESEIYSANEANFTNWSATAQKVVTYLRDGRGKAIGRYVGSLVADFHRNLLKGGVYLYPADKKAPEGKIRLLYEAAPLAMIATQTGGRATTGTQEILDIQPLSPHHRCPTIIGSAAIIREIERIYKES